MSGTSLSRQLAAISGEERKGRGKPSLLFSATEAETADLHAIYSIGCNGLAELTSLDARFAAFNKDLFSEAWRDLDRETSGPDVNVVVNNAIFAFCDTLSQYFMLKPAAKTLEYLIRRFKAHTYNVDALLRAALPHHDSVLFGRLFALLDLSAPAATPVLNTAVAAKSASANTAALFAFARDCQKPAAPLPRELLAQQCLKDAAFLSYICDFSCPREGLTLGLSRNPNPSPSSAPASTAALEELGDSPATASAASVSPASLRMCAAVLVDAIARSGSVTDRMLNATLPSIIASAESRSVDRQIFAATVITALSVKCQMAKHMFEGLVGILMLNVTPSTLPAITKCLATLFATQAMHQHIVMPSSQVEHDAALAAADGETAPRQWLAGFQVPPEQLLSFVKKVQSSTDLAASPVVQALLDASLAVDCRMWCKVLLISLLQAVAASYTQQLGNLLVAVTREMPVTVLAPLVVPITKYCVSRYKSIQRSKPAALIGTPQIGCLTDCLQRLAIRFPSEVDAGLQSALTSRRKSRSNSVLGDSQEAATDIDNRVFDWVTTALYGTSIATVTSGSAAGDNNLSLAVALAHASPSIRLRGINMLKTMVSSLASADKDAAGSSHEALQRTVLNAVSAGLEDEDSGVVAATVHVLRDALSSNVAIGPNDVELEEASGSGSSASFYVRVAKAATQLLDVAARWVPRCTIRIDSGSDAATLFGSDVNDVGKLHAAGAQLVVGSVLQVLVGLCLPKLESMAALDHRMVAPGLDHATLARSTASLIVRLLPIGNEAYAIDASVHTLVDIPLANLADVRTVAVLAASSMPSDPLQTFKFFHRQPRAAQLDFSPCVALALRLIDALTDGTGDAVFAVADMLAAAGNDLRSEMGTATVLDTALDLALAMHDGGNTLGLAQQYSTLQQAGIIPSKAGKAKGLSSASIQKLLATLTMAAATRFRNEFRDVREQLVALVLRRRERHASRRDKADSSVAPQAAAELLAIRGCHPSHLPSAGFSQVPHGGKDPHRQLWKYADFVFPPAAADSLPQSCEQGLYNMLRARTSLAVSGLSRVMSGLEAIVRVNGVQPFGCDAYSAVQSMKTMRECSTMAEEVLAKGGNRLVFAIVSRLYVLLCGTPEEGIASESVQSLLQRMFSIVQLAQGTGLHSVCLIGCFTTTPPSVPSLVALRSFQLLRAFLRDGLDHSGLDSAALLPYAIVGTQASSPSVTALTPLDACTAVPSHVVRQSAWAFLRDAVTVPADTSAKALLGPVSNILRNSTTEPHAAKAIDQCVQDPSALLRTLSEWLFGEKPVSRPSLSDHLIDWALNEHNRRSAAHISADVLRILGEMCIIAVADKARRKSVAGFVGQHAEAMRAFCASTLTALRSQQAGPAALQSVEHVLLLIGCFLNIHASDEGTKREPLLIVCFDALLDTLQFPTLYISNAAAQAGMQSSTSVVMSTMKIITPSIFHLAHRTRDPSAPGKNVGRRLLQAIFSVAAHGDVNVTSNIRQVLARLPLEPHYFVDLFDDEMLVFAAGSRKAAKPGSSSDPAYPFAQALCSSPSKLSSWFARATLVTEVLLLHLQTELHASVEAKHPFTDAHVLVRPLFAVLETILVITNQLRPTLASNASDSTVEWTDEDLLSSSEYLQRVTCECLHSIAESLLSAGGKVPADVRFNADATITVIQTTTSTQTRAIALLLLGATAALFPTTVLSRLMPVLLDIDSAILVRDDSTSLNIVRRLVEVVVPALLAHGDQLGVTVYSLLRVFTSKIPSIPQHRQQLLFTALLEATSQTLEDKSAFLPAVLGLLCHHHAISNENRGIEHSFKWELAAGLIANYDLVKQVQAFGRIVEAAGHLFRGSDGKEALSEDAGSASHEVPLHGLIAVITAADGDAISTHTLPKPIVLRIASNILQFVEKMVMSELFRAKLNDDESDQDEPQVALLDLCARLLDVVDVVADHQVAASQAAPEASIQVAGSKRKSTSTTPTQASTIDARDSQRHRFWNSVMDQCFATFQALGTAMHPPQFLTLLQTLLQHQSIFVQRRSLAFLEHHLASRLGKSKVVTATPSPTVGMEAPEAKVYADIAAPLMEGFANLLRLSESASKSSEIADAIAQHEEKACIFVDALAVLAAYFAASYASAFVPLTSTLVNLLQLLGGADKAKPAKNAPLLASSLLRCTGIWCCQLGAGILVHFPKIASSVVHLLDATLREAASRRSDIIIAALQAVKLIATTLPQFIHPYLSTLLPCLFHPLVSLAGIESRPSAFTYFDRHIVPDVAASSSSDDQVAGLRHSGYYCGVASPGAPADELLDVELVAESLHGKPPSAKSLMRHPVFDTLVNQRELSTDIVKHILRSVALRVLLPPLMECYARNVEVSSVAVVHQVRAVHALVTISTRKEIREHVGAVFGFITNVMDFRWKEANLNAVITAVSGDVSDETLHQHAAGASVIETELAALLVACILKLNEAQAKPLFIKLLQWAAASAEDIRSELEVVGLPAAIAALADEEARAVAFSFAQMCRKISAFRILQYVSMSLRSLFVPFYAYVLPELAKDLQALVANSKYQLALLDSVQVSSTFHDVETFADSTVVPSSPHALRCMLLACLHQMMQNDTEPDPDGFMSAAKYGRQRLDVILKPLVQQLEVPPMAPSADSSSQSSKRKRNEVEGGVPSSSQLMVPGGRAGYLSFARTYIIRTVGSLVAALRRDTLWKQLNSALLLQSRSDFSRVRLATIECVSELFRQGGDEAIVLVPETLPFLSELLAGEDNEEIAAANELLHMLEEKTGEDLQHYLA